MAKQIVKKYSLKYWHKHIDSTRKLKYYMKSKGSIARIIWFDVLDLVFSDYGWCIIFDPNDPSKLYEMIANHNDLNMYDSKSVEIEDLMNWIKGCIKEMLKQELICKKMFALGCLTSRSIQLELMRARKRGRVAHKFKTEFMFGQFCLLPQEEWDIEKEGRSW